MTGLKHAKQITTLTSDSTATSLLVAVMEF